MTKHPKSRLLLYALACVMGLMLVSAEGLADPITLQANTSGAFISGSSGATVGGGGQTITATAGGTSSTITFNTVPNQVSVAINPGEVTNVTLGVFSVTSNSRLPLAQGPNFSGAQFTLTVSFTVPSGAGSQQFNGNLTGQIIETASSTVIQWTSPLTLTFTSANGTVFQLTIESITTINPPLTGGVSNPPSQIRARLTVLTGPTGEIPEPGTLLLLSSGLFGLAAVARRKFRTGRQQVE